MLSISLLRYELSDILDIENDKELVKRYKLHVKDFSQDKLESLYEWLVKQSIVQLSKLRLAYKPRTNVCYASLYITTKNIKNSTTLIVKDEFFSVPVYRLRYV